MTIRSIVQLFDNLFFELRMTNLNYPKKKYLTILKKRRRKKKKIVIMIIIVEIVQENMFLIRSKLKVEILRANQVNTVKRNPIWKMIEVKLKF